MQYRMCSITELILACMQDTTTTHWGWVKQHTLTLHEPTQLGHMRNWDNMDGVLAILEPGHCWTAYTKMNEKVQVTHHARVETVADVALMSLLIHRICITFVCTETQQ